jgi:histidinol-phosphate aminotransferase
MLTEVIHLDLNEIPYLPPSHVTEAVTEGAKYLNRYTGIDDINTLKELISSYSGVAEEHIIVSPGSELLLREILLCFANKRKVITISPTFLPIIQTARVFSQHLVSLRLTPPDFSLPRHPLMEELSEPTLLIIDNPNNPTGLNLIDRQMVEDILATGDTLLVIDEAYYEFAVTTFVDMVEEHPNLAVTRTFDKAFALAGARIGYLIAGEQFLQAFSTFPRFLSQTSLSLAIKALRYQDYMRDNVLFIQKERERVYNALHELGFSIFESKTNFLLVKTHIDLFAKLLHDSGILVSDVSSQLGPGFIRITIGTSDENDSLIRTCREISEKNKEELI